MKIIDASGLILGRLATHVAKLALQNEEVAVINCEKAVISGDRKKVIKKFLERRSKGDPFHGPFYPKQPDRIVKRAIRGMLPYKKQRAREALKRVKCYIGAPAQLEGDVVQVPNASKEKLIKTKTVSIGEISQLLGAKR